MNYTANDIAKKTGLSLYTIRYYAKEGLFPNLERNENGVRIFTAQDLHWIYLIEHLKCTGMTIKEIKTFITWCAQGDETLKERMEFFVQKKAEVKRKIEELNKTLDFVTYKEWEYKKAYEAGTSAVIVNMDEDLIPDKLKKIRDTIAEEREYPRISSRV